jgi:AcrR family transcriptional regulator
LTAAQIVFILNKMAANLAPGSEERPDDPDDPVRSRLLAAAARVFARQGYEGTKIMDVVREAGLSTGAVYGRFFAT